MAEKGVVNVTILPAVVQVELVRPGVVVVDLGTAFEEPAGAGGQWDFSDANQSGHLLTAGF